MFTLFHSLPVVGGNIATLECSECAGHVSTYFKTGAKERVSRECFHCGHITVVKPHDFHVPRCLFSVDSLPLNRLAVAAARPQIRAI